jgi:ATP-dependent Clp protease ATP-binding subunit ClpB
MAGPRKILDPTKMSDGAGNVADGMAKRIVGQDQAIEQIVSLYQTFLAGMSAPGRPVGSLLFLGPTGSGKTRTVEALAETLTGNPRAVVKIDCAEFQHSHEIAKLVGSPPGYLGHRETHAALSQEVLNQHQTDTCKLSFVLFDEIEKASDALWNLLLGILDKATLTMGDNKRVDFSRTIIFMTSNLGASEMAAVLRPKLGFGTAEPVDQLSEKLSRVGADAARRRFSPEFMNRIDGVVSFKPLGAPELQRILDIELLAVHERIFHAMGSGSVILSLNEGAREFLLREGTDSRYGARHLKRAIETRLTQPLSRLIASGQVKAGEQLLVECDGNCLIFAQETGEAASQTGSDELFAAA